VIVAFLGLSWATQHTVSAVYEAQNAKNVSERLGISVDQAMQMVKQDEQAQGTEGLRPGIAVLGVLPLAVGLAYLVFYYTDDSRKKIGPTAPPE
jgi:hypothetical protein